MSVSITAGSGLARVWCARLHLVPLMLLAPLLVAVLTSGSATAQGIERVAAGVAPPGSRPPGETSGKLAEDDSYQIGPGDLLDVRVYGRAELTREVRVTNQGTIRLPFLDEIRVACQTEAQLGEVIAEKYRKYLRDPQVDVFVREYKSQPVSVIGSVMQPGRFQLQRRVRLLELLTFAGIGTMVESSFAGRSAS